ncbi:MAG TPA: YigZ family protein, partial [Candidatus Avilachnospira avicola]|nr:YigZ family protein [Candidatus Avilachnospira avicola]
VIFERSSDDGEPQGTAGRPMLDMLKGNGITDAVCVVTRYFGGTLLGTGGLLRAYSDALREALSRSEILELMEGREAFGDISYDLISKVKHVASGSSVRIMSEEYGETVRMSFLSDREGICTFSLKLSELSAGKIRLFDEQDVLYYGTDRPKVYKKL